MKFHTRRLLSLLLMLSLFVSLLSVGAYAVDVPEITCELGTALDYTIPLEGDDSADGYLAFGGSLPGFGQGDAHELFVCHCGGKDNKKLKVES